jgi:hypothetical protein
MPTGHQVLLAESGIKSHIHPTKGDDVAVLRAVRVDEVLVETQYHGETICE